MNEALASGVKRTNTASTFLRGAKSGAVSGGLMMGIYAIVGAGIFGLGLMHAPLIGATILTTSLFSGVMSVIRGKGHAPVVVAAPATVRVGRSAQSPALAQEMSQAQTVEQTAPVQGKWTNAVGGPSQGTGIQKILEDRAMSDKTRAQAILADRENAVNSGRSV